MLQAQAEFPPHIIIFFFYFIRGINYKKFHLIYKGYSIIVQFIFSEPLSGSHVTAVTLIYKTSAPSQCGSLQSLARATPKVCWYLYTLLEEKKSLALACVC